jgi:hypothetical protein
LERFERWVRIKIVWYIVVMIATGLINETLQNGPPVSIALKKQQKMLPGKCFTTKVAVNLSPKAVTERSGVRTQFLREMTPAHQGTENIEK